MNTQGKHQIRNISIILALLFSALIYAIAVFDPPSTPTNTLGKYTLSGRDLKSGNLKAFRPWFENGAWQGDLIEYDILSSIVINSITERGYRRTDVDVGANPPTQGNLGYCGRTPGCWSARATFRDNGADDVDGTYWQNRNIITRDITGNTQADFVWDTLTVDQKKSLDPDKINDHDGDPSTPPLTDLELAGSQGNYFSPVLNFIRGERFNESSTDTAVHPTSTADLRTRYSVLGDVTASPLYVGPPQELYSSFAGYSDFHSSYSSREGRIATPANDGMLHIFDEDDGSEVFAYVPSMVIDKLPRLKERAYQHTYFFDGELIEGSAQITPGTCTTSDTSGCNWHTVLAGGGGAGFEGLFALDFTDQAFTSDKLLFELTSADATIGHIYGAPRIAPLGSATDPEWHIISGNGYKSACTGINSSDCNTDTNHQSALLLVSLDSPGSPDEITTGTNGGLSSPALFSIEGTDLLPEIVFAGDINGDLWMFKLDKETPSNTTAHKVFAGDPDRPITTTPAISRNPIEPGSILVYFGTGSLFSLYDALNDGRDNSGNYTQKQAIHAIWIRHDWLTNDNATISPISSSNLRTQPSFDTESGTFTVKGQTVTKEVRVFPSVGEVNYICADGDTTCIANQYKGWTVELPNCGERLIGSPFIRAERLQFVTTNPTGLNCGTTEATGDSWLMSLDYLTGGDAGTVFYNLNGDEYLDSGDTVTSNVPAGVTGTGSGNPPVGLRLGEGNISQPSFVRVETEIDKLYINGIILPGPTIPNPGPLLFGHIDVVTDSPLGGDTSPNGIDKHSEGYQTADTSEPPVADTPDGLGKAVDGHVHAYDTIHGISYVDLFELEPRRGQASLAATAVPTTGTCSIATNSKQVTVVDDRDPTGGTIKCIEEVEPELNRLYDTLTPTTSYVDPNDDNTCPPEGETRFGPFYTPVFDDADDPTKITTCEKTEIIPNSEVGLDKTKQFIVVLANADLSTLASLQIGCKVWNGGLNNEDVNELIQLQDEIASELERGTAPLDIDDPKYGEPVVFTLNSITNNTDLAGNDLGHICPADSPNPTLRVIFQEDYIQRQGLLGTRSQCVLGLHSPADDICYADPDVLNVANTAVLDTRPLIEADVYRAPSCTNLADPSVDPIPDRYVKDPALNQHITKALGNDSGYRWRNGALTVQLLDIESFVKLECPDDTCPWINLQDPSYLPLDNKGRKGGTYAKAFDSITEYKTGNATIELFNSISPSGLLYEAAIYWHYSDLADNLQSADPRAINCYGNPAYSSALTQEERGLNLGQYIEWREALEGTDDLARFAELLEEIADPASEADLNQALLELSELFENNSVLREYAKYRDYVPGSVIPEQQLLDIDKNLDDGGNTNTSSYDATPADVTSIEDIDIESKGPASVKNQRVWTDIRN